MHVGGLAAVMLVPADQPTHTHASPAHTRGAPARKAITACAPHNAPTHPHTHPLTPACVRRNCVYFRDGQRYGGQCDPSGDCYAVYTHETAIARLRVRLLGLGGQWRRS